MIPAHFDLRIGKKGVISTDDSAWKAIVMPTNEELMIALSTMRVLGK